jgi:hypothetical protein
MHFSLLWRGDGEDVIEDDFALALRSLVRLLIDGRTSKETLKDLYTVLNWYRDEQEYGAFLSTWCNVRHGKYSVSC